MLVNVTRKIIVPLYEDPTRFIFELLQNAEDALSKRGVRGSRTVSFELSSSGLKVSHFGKPFDESNVRAICSVGDSSKQEEVTAIGKFGIGFKSVYSLTERPEVHSGEEHFAIKDFVHPVEVQPMPLDVGETAFWFPFKPDIGDTPTKIQSALENLPASSLLFLKHINEIRWSVEDGESEEIITEAVTQLSAAIEELNQVLKLLERTEKANV